MDATNGSNGPLLILSENANKILSKHSHLDLTEDVELVDPVIRGCGGYSDVYLGRFIKNGTFVAIKRLQVHIQKERKLSKVSDTFGLPFRSSSEILQNISRELGIWSSLDHPNVLPLLGYTMNGGATFAFICQWMENGTAREYLREHPETDTFQMV